jgi:hypothetical protein
VKNSELLNGFWIEVIWNLMMADLVSQKKDACTFFLWKWLVLLHFLNLKTPTEDSRLRHWRDFGTPLSHREAVTGLILVILIWKSFYSLLQNVTIEHSKFQNCTALLNWSTPPLTIINIVKLINFFFNKLAQWKLNHN